MIEDDLKGKEWLSTVTMARNLDCSIDTIERAIQRKEMEAKKWGRYFRVHINEFQKYKAQKFKSVG